MKYINCFNIQSFRTQTKNGNLYTDMRNSRLDSTLVTLIIYSYMFFQISYGIFQTIKNMQKTEAIISEKVILWQKED